MKVVGIVAEYNPFHNGHQYQIQEAKKQTGADYVIVVMSGNFLQRGGPAIIHKYARTKAALEGGADLVFELPVVYSTASAELFALGAVSLLDKLRIVDYLCFASELGDIEPLITLATYLHDDSDKYNTDINKFMKKGFSYPEARQAAISKNKTNIDDKIISSPNNILAIEYIKALLNLKSAIKPITISRIESAYHEPNLNNKFSQKSSPISSATAIRKAIALKSNKNSIKAHLPRPSFNILKEEYEKTFPIYEDDFSLLLKYKLLGESNKSLKEYIDVSTDLANRIKKLNPREYNFTSLAKEIKSKNWTLARINRSLIHILLNLKSKNLELYNNTGYSQYARLLGLNKDSSALISAIKKNGKIPIITKLSDSYDKLPQTGLQMINEDIFATDLYNLIIYEKYGLSLDNEFKQGLILRSTH